MKTLSINQEANTEKITIMRVETITEKKIISKMNINRRIQMKMSKKKINKESSNQDKKEHIKEIINKMIDKITDKIIDKIIEDQEIKEETIITITNKLKVKNSILKISLNYEKIMYIMLKVFEIKAKNLLFSKIFLIIIYFHFTL
jgi:hypothetical protein